MSKLSKHCIELTDGPGSRVVKSEENEHPLQRQVINSYLASGRHDALETGRR